jgi:hypothetical protein
MKEILDCIVVDMDFININLDPTAKWVFIVLLSFRSDLVSNVLFAIVSILFDQDCVSPPEIESI